ncbi:EAL domain-containing protein [Paenibacillus sp. KACC 21273]|uniref:putative bifunctional diguanylate cyclase/phosphodiesterase n=1 Tax=Paenibacillus sp. KACC 21273 TaxID=3025665 RepID=UPI00236545C8|nr:bifunctional diguanylate cyclase/phosphodiesterase [Paenibacillus sp. KACC 21273]WDF48909.1 EAL domain-containing protein [Paenibacillus sp. KACC 21273]
MFIFVISVISLFVPFLFLTTLAINVILRNPKHSLHRLTMMVMFTLGLIFLSDFLMHTLEFQYGQLTFTFLGYNLSFLAMTLLIYFFANLSHLRIPRYMVHLMACIPLIGIPLLNVYPYLFNITITQSKYWRVEDRSLSFDLMFIVIALYSLTTLITFVALTYRKMNGSLMYQREKRMMRTIMRGSILAALWLVITFVITSIYKETPYFPIASLPAYSGVILAVTLHIAMHKYNFLAAAERRYKLLFTLSSSGIALMNRNGIAVEANPAFRLLAAVDESEGEIDIFAMLQHEDKHNYRERLKKAFENRTILQNSQVQIRNLTGMTYIVEVNNDFLEIDGELYCYLLVRDITAQQLNEAQLIELAYNDPLTGLSNRFQFNRKLWMAVDKANEDGTKVVVMQIDLDHFKWINDTMGHSAGDILLRHVAQLLQDYVPPHAVVARMGGDEFSIMIELAPGEGEQLAIDIANQIIHAFEQQVVIVGKYYRVSCSIGISISPDDGEDSETLLRHADTAMYVAKRSGRNQYHIFTKQLKRLAEKHLLLQQGLENALSLGEFSLVYQPQVDSRTQQVFGVEALLRWSSPDLGIVSPVDFIPIAEQNGTIRQIGEWVMREAAYQAAAWIQAGHTDLQISVNVSASQLSDPNFANKVEAILKETGLPAHLLCLEFTESEAIREEEQILKVCKSIVDMGVVLAVDDFGTGYSSLRTITRFPFQFIKIDRSLIYDIGTNPRNVAVVRSVIELAQQLNMNVIAEGAEMAEQVEMLSQLGCFQIQGYYYGKPMRAKDIERKLYRDLEENTRIDQAL